MDLEELGAFLFQPDLRDLLRVETRDWYDSAADDPHYQRWLDTGVVELDDRWRAWLDRIRRDSAAGIRWRRIHVLTEPEPGVPLPDYLRFELGVQYVCNAEAGEDIRILTAPAHKVTEMTDLFVVNGDRVALSTYDHQGRFVRADDAPRNAPHWTSMARRLWERATPFAQWWAAHPEHHERPSVP